jgi:dUTP pyrophosphatase
MTSPSPTLSKPTVQSVTVGIFRLPHAPEALPAYATEGSAGMDLQAALAEPLTLQPLERQLVPTGLVFEIPVGYEVQIRPRSGLSIKHGITLVNCVGTIDSDYHQEVKIPVINLSQEAFTLQPGDRVAQMVVAPVTQACWQVLTQAPTETTRFGGFGSTGIQGNSST